MENTIATLEYTLKDTDVKGQPVIQQMIQDLIIVLRKVLVVKKKKRVEQENEMGLCKCGCQDTVLKQSF
jgi:hypothetical protein